ncbi:MAG: ATP-grasp domain-containing protein [Duncaniella sp.]|nr:ATP-grasp domain-containing protein [Duncaniella sp.]
MSRSLNILFLGGAKRVAVGKMILAAARKRGIDARIFGYELDVRVPLAAIGTIIPGKKWNDPDFPIHLEEVVDELGITMLLPFVDGAIAPAARFAASHPGVSCPVSSSEVAEFFFDKCISAEIFAKASLPIPETVTDLDRAVFPLIAKPRRGSASKGIEILTDREALDRIRPVAGEYLVQRYIPDATEITVDCYVAADGRILTVSPRIRLETAGGEAVRTVTVDSPEAVTLAERTIQATGLRGACTIQLLRDSAGNLMIMEINPRPGGGVVASVNAGANIPSLIVDEWAGLPLDRTFPRPGVLTVRYLEDIAFLPDGTKI